MIAYIPCWRGEAMVAAGKVRGPKEKEES